MSELKQLQALAADHYRNSRRLSARCVELESGQESMRAEIERLRLDLDAKDALNVSAYHAGLKAGWNFCDNEDEIGFAVAISSTDHIAELRRINAARQALGDKQ